MIDYEWYDRRAKKKKMSTQKWEYFFHEINSDFFQLNANPHYHTEWFSHFQDNDNFEKINYFLKEYLLNFVE